MQLTGPAIEKRMHKTVFQKLFNTPPDIVIEPYFPECLGSNSYDLHLNRKLSVYKTTLPKGMKPVIEFEPNKPLTEYSMRDWFDDPWAYSDYCLYSERYDIRNPKYMLNPFDAQSHETVDVIIPDNGAILNPNLGYLGSTLEYTETRNIFPYIDGKSTIGRNFILNHHTAGRGDDGFCGQWTLEIRVLCPTLVMPYMRIGQIYYEQFRGKRKPYNRNPHSHYNNQTGPTPAAPLKQDQCILNYVAQKSQELLH
jgi:dCTP deaminase